MDNKKEIIPICFVSAFINLKEDRSKNKSPEKCFNYFRTLASSGIHILLFMSPDYAEIGKQFEKDFPNVKIVELLELEDLETYKIIKELGFTELPERRTENKDTLKFMILMNSKMEFIKRANEKYNEISFLNYAWIDFSICHVIKNPKETLSRLYTLANSKMKHKGINFPGCNSYEKSRLQMSDCLNSVMWRFCGGFFFGDIDSINIFYNLQIKTLKIISEKSKIIPWEVNLWAITEDYHNNFIYENELINVYMADHNDSMFNNIRFSEHIRIDTFLPMTLETISNYNYNKYNNEWIFFSNENKKYNENIIRLMVDNITKIGLYQNGITNGYINSNMGFLVHSSMIKSIKDFLLTENGCSNIDKWMLIYCFFNNVKVYNTCINLKCDIIDKLPDNKNLNMISNENKETLNKLEDEYGLYFLKEGKIIYKDEVDKFDISKYIDKIFYINLEYRKDRKEQIENELNRFNLPYERFEAVAYPEFGIVGCSYSHLSVLRIAKERGYKNVLIFEDDFMFLESKAEFVYNIKKLFENDPTEFDVCMLSYNLLKNVHIPDKPYLLKVLEVQTASGYIVNNTMYDRLIELYEWAFPLLKQTKQHWIYANDQIWKRFQPDSNWYCFKTRLGKQRPSYSDNGKSWAELDC